ncbi:MAG: hypothetical protein WCD18_22995 [Thermosynechococcaceae cyanobacterium]
MCDTSFGSGKAPIIVFAGDRYNSVLVRSLNHHKAQQNDNESDPYRKGKYKSFLRTRHIHSK